MKNQMKISVCIFNISSCESWDIFSSDQIEKLLRKTAKSIEGGADVLTRFQQATLMYASRKVTLTQVGAPDSPFIPSDLLFIRLVMLADLIRRFFDESFEIALLIRSLSMLTKKRIFYLKRTSSRFGIGCWRCWWLDGRSQILVSSSIWWFYWEIDAKKSSSTTMSF